VPEFIGDRFYSQARAHRGRLCLIICSVTYVIGQMKGVGVAFSRFLEVDYDTGLYVGMGIVFFYAVLGGMKGITYTQIAQYCVLILAYTIPAIFISLQLTGNPLPQLGLGSTLVGTDVYLLDRSTRWSRTSASRNTRPGALVGPEHVRLHHVADDRHGGSAARDHPLLHGAEGARRALLRGLGAGVHRHPVHDRTRRGRYGAPESDADHRTRAGSVPRLRRASAVVPQLGDHGPAAVRGQERRRPIQYSADADTNEMVKVDNDIMVLANPEIAQLPNWVIALVAAGGLAAALSTAAGLLLAISSAISHDLLKGMLTPNISEKTELNASRVAMAVAIAGAGYLGLNPPGFAAGTVALAFGLAASSIFPALMMGIFSKRVSKEGAIAGMVAGISITLFYVFQHKGIMFIPGTAFLGDSPANWFLGIEPNAFGVVGAIVNFAVAFGVSRVTAAPPESVQELVESIRIPAGAEAAIDH
jgi:cation/acetate symporter